MSLYRDFIWRLCRAKRRWHRMIQSEPDVMLECRISASLARDIEQFQRSAELDSTRDLMASMVALWRWADERSRDGKAIVALDERTMRYNELEMSPLVTLKTKALAERALNNAGMSGETTT